MVLLLRHAATPDQIVQMLGDWEVLINIRPRQGNRRMQIESETTRNKMEPIIRRILEDQT